MNCSIQKLFTRSSIDNCSSGRLTVIIEMNTVLCWRRRNARIQESSSTPRTTLEIFYEERCTSVMTLSAWANMVRSHSLIFTNNLTRRHSPLITIKLSSWHVPDKAMGIARKLMHNWGCFFAPWKELFRELLTYSSSKQPADTRQLRK